MKVDKKNLNPPDTDFLKNSHSASETECTGLMRNVPQSEAELESYQDLFQMEVPDKNKYKLK